MDIKRSLNNDLTYGLSMEDKVMNKLACIFGDSLKNTKELYNNEYCIYDFERDDGASFELKCRRNTKYAYYTTIIPVHKVRHVETNQYFVFRFTDKLCYILYDKVVFDGFDTRIISVYRSGASPTPQNHYEIPVHLLIDIS
jgi:hypothetical protein